MKQIAIINKARRFGKGVSIIELSATNQVAIVVRTEEQKKSTMEYAKMLGLHIPTPIVRKVKE